MSFRIVELICYLAGGVGIFGGSGPNPFPGTYGGTTSGAELLGSRANPLPHAFAHIVALTDGEDANGEIHGEDDPTVGCVGVFRSAAVALCLRPEQTLPFGLSRPEPAVVRRREARGAERSQRVRVSVHRTAAQRGGEQNEHGGRRASHGRHDSLRAAALCRG